MPEANFLHRPLPSLLISFIFGLIVGDIYRIDSILVSLTLIFSLIIFLIYIVKKRGVAFFLPLSIFFLLGIQFIGSALYPEFPPHHISKFASKYKVGVIGTITRPPLYLPDKVRFLLSVEKVRPKDEFFSATGLMSLTVKRCERHITLGDRIGLVTKIRPIQNFNNYGNFDYKRYMASQGIWVRGYVERERDIVKIGKGGGSFWLGKVEVLRSQIRKFLEGQLNPTTSGLYKAIIIGEKSGIDKNLRTNFHRAGVSHILAISGLHVGIIALISFYVCKRLLLLSEGLALRFNIPKLAILLSVGPVTCYAFISGMAIPTLRATLMILSLYACILLQRERDIYNTIALAAFIILIISPASIFNISFQLSFAAVLSVIYFVPPLLKRFLKEKENIHIRTPPPIEQKLLRLVVISIVVSFVAILGTAPILAYHFNHISIIGIVANVLVIPLIGFLALPLGLLSSLMIPISKVLAIGLINVGELVLGLALHIIGFLSALPWGSFRISTPTTLEITLFYTLIFLLFNVRRWRWIRYILPLVILLGLFDQIYYYYITHYSSKLRVTFLDVGHGNSALVQFPRGRNMLIDGGGFPDRYFDVGERVVARFLWHQKIKNIDYLVLSHPHPDHLNGLPFIAENFGVKEFWSNGESVNTEPYQELMEIISRKKIAKPTLGEFKHAININGVQVRVIYPPENFIEDKTTCSWWSLNNNSLVIKICLKDNCIIFPGDIGEDAEKELIDLNHNLNASVLLAPHHGSSSSSSVDFLEKVRPRIAIFSTGLPYRFPSRDVIRRYRDLGCKIYRINQDGCVTVTIYGDHLTVQKFLEEL